MKTSWKMIDFDKKKRFSDILSADYDAIEENQSDQNTLKFVFLHS